MSLLFLLASLVIFAFYSFVISKDPEDPNFDELQNKNRMKAYFRGFTTSLALSLICTVYAFIKIKSGNYEMDARIVFGAFVVVSMSGLIVINCSNILSSSFKSRLDHSKSPILVFFVAGCLYTANLFSLLTDTSVIYHTNFYIDVMLGISWLSMSICLTIRQCLDEKEEREENEE